MFFPKRQIIFLDVQPVHRFFAPKSLYLRQFFVNNHYLSIKFPDVLFILESPCQQKKT